MVKTNFPYCFFSILLIFKKKNGFIHTILKPFFMNVDKDELCCSEVSSTQPFKLRLSYFTALHLVHKFILGKRK